MARYMMLALTNPVKGCEAEFNSWYDNVAIPAYRNIPGFTTLGRFRLVDLPKQWPFQMDSQWEYLALYSFETDDMAAFGAAAQAAMQGAKNYSFSDAIDTGAFFEPVFVALN